MRSSRALRVAAVSAFAMLVVSADVGAIGPPPDDPYNPMVTLSLYSARIIDDELIVRYRISNDGDRVRLIAQGMANNAEPDAPLDPDAILVRPREEDVAYLMGWWNLGAITTDAPQVSTPDDEAPSLFMRALAPGETLRGEIRTAVPAVDAFGDRVPFRPTSVNLCLEFDGLNRRPEDTPDLDPDELFEVKSNATVVGYSFLASPDGQACSGDFVVTELAG